MVLTVEPGIYLDEEAVGIRIEDDVLVTPEGAEVLSAHIPKDPIAIETLMRATGLGNRPLAPPLLSPDAASQPDGPF